MISCPIMKCKVKNGLWTFKCPWCRKTHIHGAGEGYRSSHCLVYKRMYYIVLEEGEQ